MHCLILILNIRMVLIYSLTSPVPTTGALWGCAVPFNHVYK